MRTARLLWGAAGVLALLSPARAATLGAAFLDTGLGGRALGMGGALAAVADGPAAVFYNPAGLAAARGAGVLASYQSLSLERRQASLAGFANLRGGLAFGLAWLHAGAGGLQARNGSGEVYGEIDDGEDAVVFALGSAVGPRLAVGAGVKLLGQHIDVPQAGESSASGRAVDLGLRLRVGANTVAGLVLRNLGDKLSWTVARPAAQTGATAERLASAAVVGLSHRYRQVLLGAVDVELRDLGGGRALRAHAGLELALNELVTLRCGLHRIGDAEGVGLPSLGLTLRPMRVERVQLTYAHVSDDLDAGGRTIIAVTSRF